ncbi:exo-alpha-sialidase [Kribbella sp. HUAS MG21]|uniref:exo-alpha-sialidase n=1 Tax=Kribbella sp. HUAS MG21 TaxID=3160966 RepID=A0AAU7T658_9ACTN
MSISRRNFTLGLAAGTAAAALPSPALAASHGVTPDGATGSPRAPYFAETTLWDSAVDPLASYFVYGLVVLPDDTIIACTEGRHETCDAGPHDLLIRRSTDGGQTWTATQAVAVAVDRETWANPTFVVDRSTGEVFLFHNLCEQLPENTSCSADSSTVYVISSTDGGATWSERRSLAGMFDHFPYNWAMHGPGPGHGIQLASGRLVLTVSHRTIITGVPAAQRNYGVSTIYSDDHGRTWQAGGEVPMRTDLPALGEARLVQRSDGTVVMNSRPGSGQDWPRGIAVSSDGGETWSESTLDFNAGLFNGCDNSLINYPGGRMVFSRPDAPMRWNMTVSVSYDEGYSFRYSRTVNPGRSYYSDLAHLSDGTIVLLYGCDGELDGSPRRVSVARFNLEWLTQGRDSLATGPQLSERSFDLGNTAPAARRSGGTVAVVREPTARRGARAVFTPDAAGDFIEYSVTAGSDAEYELWLRYHRSSSGGLVTVTVDGRPLRNSSFDFTTFRLDGYAVALLGRLRLQAGRHTIRFTSAGAGRGGGTTMSLDELSMVRSAHSPDVREEVTVDNGGDLGFSVVGTWPSSRGVPGYYGFNYTSHAKGTGANVARWRPALPGGDRYEVLASFSAGTNRATDATYVVHHADGVTPVAVDQTQRGVPELRTGEWVSLGTFRFEAGIDGYVELSDAASNVVIADAVRFRRQPA